MSISQAKKEEAIRAGNSLRLAREFKRDLLKGEQSTLLELARAYREIVARLRPQWEKTVTSLAAATEAGETSPLLVSRRDDLKGMLSDSEYELERYNKQLALTVQQRQEQLIDMAEQDIYDLARAVAGEVEFAWARISKPYVETLVGLMRPGNPAYDLLMEFAPKTTEKLHQQIVSGLSVGQTPEKILKEFEGVLGGNLSRALTIVRTEDMRAYRETTAEAMKANGDVVIGWRWHASLSYGTCAACLSLHGEVFPLGTDMDSHPNCRCVQLPVLKDVPLEKWETGEEWLRRQPEDIQKLSLGRGKLIAWQNGEITLKDMRGHVDNPVFGLMYVEVSLEQAYKNAGNVNINKALPAVQLTSSRLPDVIPDVELGDTPQATIRNVESHLKEVWAKPGLHEKGFVVTTDNRLIMSKGDQGNRLTMGVSPIDQRGAVILHSHPLDLPPGATDMMTFVNRPLSQSVIVSPKRIYRLSKEGDGWRNPYPNIDFYSAYEGLLHARITNKGYTDAEASKLLDDIRGQVPRSEILSTPLYEAALETIRETARLYGVKLSVKRR